MTTKNNDWKTVCEYNLTCDTCPATFECGAMDTIEVVEGAIKSYSNSMSYAAIYHDEPLLTVEL